MIEGGDTLESGSIPNIIVKLMPAGTVVSGGITWESSDPNVAFVDDDGQICVIGTGNVTLTATLPDGKTVTKTFTVIPGTNAKGITFYAMDKMHYTIGSSCAIYNHGTIAWAKTAPLTFRVYTYSTFAYKTYIVYLNGTELEPNAYGSFSIPAGNENAVITITGATVDQNTGRKLSFWELLLQFFRKIIAFFTGNK